MIEFSPPPPFDLPERDDDPRIGHLIGKGSNPRVALIGFRCDDGVERNGGRVGAADAPLAIRSHLYRMTPDVKNVERSRDLWSATSDLGDIRLTGSLEEKQNELGEVVSDCLGRGQLPIIIGGGHETTFGHFLGYAKAGRKVYCLNFDAHPDVRPSLHGRKHSGSPFRDALEHPSNSCLGYSVAGLQPHAVASAHYEYMEKNGVCSVFRADCSTEKLVDFVRSVPQHSLCSIDLDVLDCAYAPGVSAPNANGLTPAVILGAVCEAGKNKNISSLDVVEVNPKYDRDGATARIAALIIWNFLTARSVP